MNLVVLSGAGLSAESGIETFRDSNGLWENHRVEDVATPEGWKRDRALVQRFYNARRAQLADVEPNAAHFALAKLEAEWKGGFLHVTQNVDDLAERAGGKNVAHIHGRLTSARCSQRSCSHVEYVTPGDDLSARKCPHCRSAMRPDVVWFGEFPHHLDWIEELLDRTDILIVIGTSGTVMPASLFPRAVRDAQPQADIIEINPKPSDNDNFNRRIEESASIGVPLLVDELLAGQTSV